MVWNTEEKCFAWEFSARATNTLQTFAYETQVFLVCGENIGDAKAFSSVWNTTVCGDECDCIATKLYR